MNQLLTRSYSISKKYIFFNLKINFYKKNLKIRPIVQIHQIDSRIQKQEFERIDFERNIFLLYFFAY